MRGPLRRGENRRVLARIHVHADWAAALVRALAAADCVSVLRGEGMLDVLMPPLIDFEQARDELAFFLEAWSLDHPLADVRLGR